MEKILNDYLEKIEKYLKPLPISERVDIVKEIKSEILELQGDGKTAEQITERLGNPKELAKAYLGDLIAKSNSFSWNRVLAICAYYGISGIENPVAVFIISIVMGVVLYLIGRGCWKLLVYYIKGVSKAKQHLEI